MKKSFRLISLLSFLLLLISCSPKTYPPKVQEYPLINVDNKAQKYNLQLDFMRKHFNGILAIRKMEDKEIRIIAVTPFGLSLFDFGLKENEEWTVYSCIEPMRKDKFLKILERDFKLLLLPERNFEKAETKDNYTKFAIGKGFSKSTIFVSPAKENIDNIKIKHAWWLGLTITLDKIKKQDATE